MSDTNPDLQENCATVSYEEFTTELEKYYVAHDENSKKLKWTRDKIDMVFQFLEEYHEAKSEGRRPTNQQYYHANKYDTMDVGHQKVLIMKKKSATDPILQVIPTEEYYEKIRDAHIFTGHGRRDKVIQALRDKYVIPIFAIKIFIDLCKTCLTKKSLNKKVVKPLCSKVFNSIGQVDVMDFQMCPDDKYRWLLRYEENMTKFCFLRPLKSKKTKDIALEIVRIFLEIGCPNILQSGNGPEFLESVLREIIDIWPACKIIEGKCHTQSLESFKQDMKDIIHIWMSENDSMSWDIGCYFAQYQKNSTYNSEIERTPYKALLGVDPKIGLSTSYLAYVVSKLKSEECVDASKENDDEKPQDKVKKEKKLMTVKDKVRKYQKEVPLITKIFVSSNKAETLPKIHDGDQNSQQRLMVVEGELPAVVNYKRPRNTSTQVFKKGRLEKGIGTAVLVKKCTLQTLPCTVTSGDGDNSVRAPFVMRSTKCVCCLERDAEEQLWAPRAHLGSYGHLVKLLFAIDFPLPDESKVIGICTRCALDLDNAMELRGRVLRAHDKLAGAIWINDTPRSAEVSNDEYIGTQTVKTEHDVDTEEYELGGVSEPNNEPETTTTKTSDVRRKLKTIARPVKRTKAIPKIVKVGEASSSSDSLPLAAVGQTAEGTRTRTGQRHFKEVAKSIEVKIEPMDSMTEEPSIKLEVSDVKLEPDDPLEEDTELFEHMPFNRHS